MNTVPEKLNAMKPQARWEWFDRQKEILREAAKTRTKAEFTPEVVEAFMYLSDIDNLKSCEIITMHHNAIVVAASALIESDFDNARDWLLNLVEQANEVTWQMYTNAQEFYDRNQLNWPDSVEDHQKNIAQSKLKAKEDAEKFDAWYEQHMKPLLSGGSAPVDNSVVFRMSDIEKDFDEFFKERHGEMPLDTSSVEYADKSYLKHEMKKAWDMATAKLESCVVVPVNNTTIVAVEKMVEQQVEASGITADVFRLDGEKILNAAVEAARGGNE